MKGLELSRKFWEEVGIKAFRENCPEVLEKAVVGLVGEGSECYGFDDEISRDHDWGPGFCVWLEDDDYMTFGVKAKGVYDSLPKEFEGYRRKNVTPMTEGRIGVMTVKQFYMRYTGRETPPETIRDWRLMPKNALPILTNGEIFLERPGSFMDFRNKLIDYFPEDLRLKKLAKECALAAQQGQYNYPRCMEHGEHVAAYVAMAQFIESVWQIVFLLEKKYAPYYKWAERRLREISPLGDTIAKKIDVLAGKNDANKVELIEQISLILIAELNSRGLSDGASSFLLDHAPIIQAKIKDESLKRLPLMAE